MGYNNIKNERLTCNTKDVPDKSMEIVRSPHDGLTVKLHSRQGLIDGRHAKGHV